MDTSAVRWWSLLPLCSSGHCVAEATEEKAFRGTGVSLYRTKVPKDYTEQDLVNVVFKPYPDAKTIGMNRVTLGRFLKALRPGRRYVEWPQVNGRSVYVDPKPLCFQYQDKTAEFRVNDSLPDWCVEVGS